MNTIANVSNQNDMIIELPKSVINKDFSLDQAIEKRRSVRNFKNQQLQITQISKLLWAAQGITDPQRSLRAAPSAGALYPLKLYVVKNDGAWIYLQDKHALKIVSNQDLRSSLSDCCLHQRAVKQAPVSIVIIGDINVTAVKYGDRAARYVYLEAGHVAQNILLEVVSMGLSSVPIGAFEDSAIQKLLKLPNNQSVLYVVPVG